MTRISPPISALSSGGTSSGASDGTFIGDFNNYVHSGALLGTAASLTGTVGVGTFYYGGTQYITTAGTHTFTGTQDTYIDINPKTSAYTYSGTSNGGAAPAQAGTSIRIAKAVTNAGSITTSLQDGSRDSLGNIIYPSFPSSFSPITKYKAGFGLTTATSLANTTFTKIPFNVTLYDPNSNYDNTTNFRYTCPVSGYYLIVATVLFSSMTSGHRGILRIYKNGSSVAETQVQTASANDATLQNTYIGLASKNDYFEAFVYQDTGGSITLGNITSQTNMFIHLLNL